MSIYALLCFVIDKSFKREFIEVLWAAYPLRLCESLFSLPHNGESMVDYWEETIQLLQPASGNQLVTKPQLKPDLLQKVPFKFLHDVITAVRLQKREPGLP